jgi:hypothetical protein
MSFSYSAGVITQSGTDTDLSGLSGLTGITDQQSGTGANARNIYVFDSSTRLEIDGTLTMSPENEEIILEASSGNLIQINSGAVFNIGQEITENSVIRYPYGTAIHSTNNGSYNSLDIVEALNGSTLNWYGGIIFSGGGSLKYRSGSTVNVFSKQCVFLRTQDGGAAQGQVRMETDNYTQNGFVDIGAVDTQDWLAFIGEWITFQGYQPIHKKSAFSPSGSSSSVNYLIENYVAGGGSESDSLFWQQKRAEFRNPSLGSNLSFVGLSGSSSSNRGIYTVTSDLRIQTSDSTGTGISTSKVYFTDFDNGDRKNDPFYTTNFTNDRVYSASAGVGGVYAEINVLTMAVVRDTGSPAGTPDVGDNKYDYRSKNNGNDDVFDINIIDYNYLINSNPIALLGNGGVDYLATLIIDSNISETTKATVDAYTELETAQKIYDAFKSELYDNYLGETETIVGRARNQVSLDNTATSLVLDSAALSVRDLTGTVATVKVNTYSGGATTAGSSTVTIQGATALNGGTFDCNGLYSSTEDTLTNVTWNGTLDFDTAGTYSIDGGTLNEVTNSSGGNVTLNLTNGATVTTNTGPNITLASPVDITAPNILTGSRVQLYNVTKGAELDNSVVSGSYSYTVNLAGAAVDDGDTIRLRATYTSGVTAKSELETTGVVTASGLSFVNSQVDHEIYNAYGVDGSTITEFSFDSGNIEVDINDADNTTEIQRLACWEAYFETTEQGIRDFFGCIDWESLNSVKIVVSMCDLKLDNVKVSPLLLVGGRMYRSDGTTIISTSSNSIQVDYEPVYIGNADDITDIKNTIDTNLDVAVSTRASQTSVDNLPASVPSATDNADAVWAKTLS